MREAGRRGRIRDLLRQVEVLEDAPEQSRRAHDLDVHVHEAGDRSVQAAQIEHERHDDADRQPPRNRFVTAHEEDERGTDGREHHDEHEEPPAEHALLDLQIAHGARFAAKALRLVGLGAEEPREQEPAHRQRLLDVGREFRQALLRLRGEFLADLSHAAGGQHEERQDAHGHQRQEPVHLDDHDERRQQHQRVRGHRHQRAAHHALDAAHVVLNARLDFTRLGGGEEPQRLAEELAVHLVAQVEHHALRHHRDEVVLPHADQPGEQRRGDHRHHVPVQQPAIAGRDRHVDHAAHQERRHQPEA